jgi:nicotinamidase-related amidase
MTNPVALLVIDVQIGMFDGVNMPPVYNGPTLLTNIQCLLAQARRTVTPIVFVQHMGHPGHPLEPGTPGWPLHPSLTPQTDEPIIQKTTPDSFYKTNLRSILEQRGIQRLVVTGIQTDLCIDTTCRRAASFDYDVWLVADAHSTWDNSVLKAAQIIAHHNAVLKGWFVSPILTDEVDFTTIGQRT